MTSSPVSRAALVAATLLLGGALVGCGASAVPAADVEDAITTELEAEDGTNPDSADCPEDLEAKKDASMVCTATAGGEEFDVKVTVTSVEGDTANFDIEPQ